MGWQFNRHVDSKLIGALGSTGLWKKLKADCESKKVFLALRKDCISFYHKGGNLFKFDNNGYSTHVKYASVIVAKQKNGKSKDYITSDELKSLKPISDFEEG
jgi:hypothetical protein